MTSSQFLSHPALPLNTFLVSKYILCDILVSCIVSGLMLWHPWRMPIRRRSWDMRIDRWSWRMAISMHFKAFFDDSGAFFSLSTAALLAFVHHSCDLLAILAPLSSENQMDKHEKWHDSYSQDRHQNWNVHASSCRFTQRIFPFYLWNIKN